MTLIHKVIIATAVVGRWTVHADMLTTRDSNAMNGAITSMVAGKVTLVSSFNAGLSRIEKTFVIDRAAIAMIEFNSTTVNIGPPPRAVGVGPPLKGGKRRTASSNVDEPDTIVLARGQQRRSCKLVGFDLEVVRCQGMEGEIPRRLVLRIVLAEAR